MIILLVILSCQVETLMKRVIAALTHQSVIIEGISCENYKVQLTTKTGQYSRCSTSRRKEFPKTPCRDDGVLHHLHDEPL